ncbi:hypothetical protein OROMI_032865 [Orobanche minor]
MDLRESMSSRMSGGMPWDFIRKVFFPKANSSGCLNLCPYVDEDPRVREVLKSGEGICLTLSSIVNRPLDLSLNSLNVRLYSATTES